METGLALREATVQDVPAIVRHRRLMFEEMGFHEGERNDQMDAFVAAYLAEAIPSGEYRGWLAIDRDGEVVAGSGLSITRLPGKPFNPSGISTYLMSLYVEPAYRRRGIARRLMETMIDWSRAQGIVEVKLHASPQGRSMYENLGFRATNEMRLLIDH